MNEVGITDKKPDICFTLVHRGKEYQVQVYRGQYYSLMTLIADYLGVFGFGLCCGMGSCGTCLVSISGNNTVAKRHGLSCEMPVNDELANVTVTVPDNI